MLARWRRTGRIPTADPDETSSAVDTATATVPETTADTDGSVLAISGDPVQPFETPSGAADHPDVVTDWPAGHPGEPGRAAA